MNFAEVMALLAALFAAATLALTLYSLSRPKENDKGELEALKQDISRELRESRQESVNATGSSLKLMGDMLARSQEQLQKTVADSLRSVDARFQSFTLSSEQRLDNMRATVENRITALQEDNGKRLDQMRATVDEKLQKTLEERLGQSFKLVSDQLDKVSSGLGEMRSLASGVGDLKKVLSNVKTRGILGEIQLGAILGELLSREQYAENIETRAGSGCPVEFAVRMPADDGGSIYLPIDAKFPMDAYSALLEAYDSADPARVDSAASALNTRIKSFARDIKNKYIDPPATTDFAVMFLPVEGLYAEVVRRGISETLQRDFKVTVAGPTTMAALLNSLQMGFRTLAIQKRSAEVWKVLGAVKTEFDRFGDALEKTQKRMSMVNQDLDELVGTRTRQIQSKLKTVTELPSDQSRRLLED